MEFAPSLVGRQVTDDSGQFGLADSSTKTINFGQRLAVQSCQSNGWLLNGVKSRRAEKQNGAFGDCDVKGTDSIQRD